MRDRFDGFPEMLRSGDESERERALERLTQFYFVPEFRRLIPALRSEMESSPIPRVRIRAAEALVLTGEPEDGPVEVMSEFSTGRHRVEATDGSGPAGIRSLRAR